MRKRERTARASGGQVYGKLDAKSGFHRKVLHVGNAAWGAFQRLNAISNSYMTDGWLDSETVKMVCSEAELTILLTPFPWTANAAALLEQVVQQNSTTYRIHDFLDWNKSKAEIEALTGKRKSSGSLGGAASATAKSQQTVSVSVSDLSLKAVSPEGESEGEVPQGRQQEYIAAYSAGIAEGKGGPYAWPGGLYDAGALNQAILTFGRGSVSGKALRGEVLLGWIRAASKDYARDITSRSVAQFYGAYGPKGFVKWLNESERQEEGKRVG